MNAKKIMLLSLVTCCQLSVMAEDEKALPINVQQYVMPLLEDVSDVISVANDYVDLNKDPYNIAQFISEISLLDNNMLSPLNLFKMYIMNGAAILPKKEVLHVLDYISVFLRQEKLLLDLEKRTELLTRVNDLIAAVNNDQVDADVLSLKRDRRFACLAASGDLEKIKTIITGSGDPLAADQAAIADATVITKNGFSIHDYGVNNTFMGRDAGNFDMTGAANTGVGINSLSTNTSGRDNTAIGANALASNTTGFINVAVGSGSLTSNTTGCRNTAIGYYASYAGSIGSDNTACGFQALNGNVTGSQNTAIGSGALITTKGSNSTAVGHSALAGNTTGAQNTAAGQRALYSNTIGDNNVAIGATTLYSNTSGSFNTAVGTAAAGSMTSGSNNVFVGYNVGGSFNSGSNNIYIDGSGSNIANENNTIRVGNVQTRCFISGIRGITTGVASAIPVLIDLNGQLGTASSSIRFKENVENMADASSAIFDLKPVTFTYKADEAQTKNFGLIAEHVDQVFADLVVYEDGVPYTVRYEWLPVLLLNEMQKQKTEIEQQRKDINALLAAMAVLQQQVQEFTSA